MVAPKRLVAIVGSAGAIEALGELLPELHPRFAAPIVIAIHSRAHDHSQLARVLGRDSLLTVGLAEDGQRLERAHVYVAPPGHHVIVRDNHLHIHLGPRENGHRPSLDVLLRSAAVACGPGAVGVILSGSLDDGVAGLETVKARGGVAVVQDPDDAIFPGLPRAAVSAVEVDYQVAASAMAGVLEKVVASSPVGDEPPEDQVAEAEVDVAALEADALAGVQLGHPAPFVCPDCGGVLWQLDDEDVLRFRCRVGHAWSAQSLLLAQRDDLEVSLWAALRALEEQADLASRMEGSPSLGVPNRFSQRYLRRGERLRHHAEQLRRLLEEMVGD
jgi:two-component system chemotaxis response regulator CheB